jgi:hypothetical protein
MATTEKSVVTAKTAAAVAITEVVGASEVLAAETAAHMPATKSATTKVPAAGSTGEKNPPTTHLAATKSTTHMTATNSTPATKSATATASASCQCIGRDGSASERDRRDDERDFVHHDSHR